MCGSIVFELSLVKPSTVFVDFPRSWGACVMPVFDALICRHLAAMSRYKLVVNFASQLHSLYVFNFGFWVFVHYVLLRLAFFFISFENAFSPRLKNVRRAVAEAASVANFQIRKDSGYKKPNARGVLQLYGSVGSQNTVNLCSSSTTMFCA